MVAFVVVAPLAVAVVVLVEMPVVVSVKALVAVVY